VIGLGVGLAHARGYQANPEAELAAICDIDPVRLRERGELLGIPLEMQFTDYQEMLKMPELDVVSVALPNYLHAPVTVAAFQAGKHVLSEKPIATCKQEAQRMVDAAKEYGKTLMVCFNYRFREDARWLLGMRDAGRLGSVYFARSGWMRNNGIPGFGGWFTDKAMSGGGPLIDLGVHILDLTLWLMGYPQPVSVSGATFLDVWPARAQSLGRPGAGRAASTWKTWRRVLCALPTARRCRSKPVGPAHQARAATITSSTCTAREGGAELYVANYTDRDTLTFYTEECGQPVMIKPAISSTAPPGTSWPSGTSSTPAKQSAGRIHRRAGSGADEDHRRAVRVRPDRPRSLYRVKIGVRLHPLSFGKRVADQPYRAAGFESRSLRERRRFAGHFETASRFQNAQRTINWRAKPAIHAISPAAEQSS
jgi:hypothetical protein